MFFKAHTKFHNMLEGAVAKLKAIENLLNPEKYKKYAIICAILFWSAAIIAFLIFPYSLKFILKNVRTMLNASKRRFYFQQKTFYFIGLATST